MKKTLARNRSLDRCSWLPTPEGLHCRQSGLSNTEIENGFRRAEPTHTGKAYVLLFAANLKQKSITHHQEAIKAAKKSPPTAGTLVDPSIPAAIPTRTYIPQEHQTATTTTTTARPIKIENPLGYDHYQSPLHPNVLVLPHSKPLQAYLPSAYPSSSTTERPAIYVTPSVHYLPSSTVDPVPARRPPHIPSLSLETPLSPNSSGDDDLFTKPIAVYGPSSTPAPDYADYGSPLVAYSPSERPGFLQGGDGVASTSARPEYESTRLSPNAIEQINNELEPPLRSTPSAYVHPSTYRPVYSSSSGNEYNNVVDTAANVQPLFNRNNFRKPINDYASVSNQIGNGYDPQYPYYDGVSDTSNGFRYFLPRQYHEEDNSNPDRRAGSYGYIDPFGIRRVVYYNTSPEGGFVHRKNNRYVGFNATPYDPRPV